MRRSEVVLAIAALVASPLAQSQVRADGAARPATTDVVEARNDASSTDAAPTRRSLMGVVMDVLIESAEQQSAREAAARQLDGKHAKPAQTLARPAPAAPFKAASEPREQVAVESEP